MTAPEQLTWFAPPLTETDEEREAFDAEYLAGLHTEDGDDDE